MEIVVNAGHTLSGAGTGAVGIYKETDKNREVEKRLVAMLKEKGHTVRDATVDKSSNDLEVIASIANRYPSADIFVSLHLNAFNGQAYGVETYIYSGAWSGKEHNRALAQKIQTSLVKNVGWVDRKVKEGNLAVLRNTTMPAVLVELGFCDNAGDMAKWNTETICRALFEGITGAVYTPPIVLPADFDAIQYLINNVDVLNATHNHSTFTAEKHYVDYGKAEGRSYKKPAPHVCSGAPEPPKGQYRVVCGTYSDRANAVKQQEELKAKGFDSFLVAI